MKRFFAFLVALMAAFGAPAQNGGVTVEVQLDQDQFLPDEDLVAGIKIVNRSGQPLTFGKSNDWVAFSFQSENGLVVPATGEVPAASEFELQSAQAGTRYFNLTPYFNFRQPGRYRLVVRIKIAEWNQEISSKPVIFTIINGVPLAEMPDLQFGVPLPQGETNRPPEVRRYVLQKANYMKQLRLYFRLVNSSGKTLRVLPIDRMVSFSVPEAQIDRSSNLHVLHQTGAKAFNYSVFNPDGQMTLRQTYDYSDTRPSLRSDSDGRIYVGGGVRRLTMHDIPSPVMPAPTAASVVSSNSPVKN